MKCNLNFINSALAEFSNHCSLHGIKYLGDIKVKWYEKIFWATILLVSFYTSFRLLLFTWSDWNESPFVIHSESKPHAVSTLPFPAMTICTKQNIYRPALVSSLFSKNESVRINTIKALHMVIDSKSLSVMEKLLELHKGSESFSNSVSNITIDKNTLNKEDFFKHLKHITFTDSGFVSPFQKMACSFGVKCLNGTQFQGSSMYGNDSSCYCLYSNYIFTNNGICFTLNMISPSDMLKDTTEFLHFNRFDVDTSSSPVSWDIDRGYDKLPNDTVFPIPIDVTNNLISIMKPSGNWSSIGKELLNQFTVAIHHPADLPNNLLTWYDLEIDRTVMLTVSPEVTYTVEALESIHAKKRNCFYSHEKELEFFKYYTRMNCITECVTKMFKDRCNCVPFYMPHSKTTEICNPSEKCVQQFSDSINHSLKFLKECHCLPMCSEVRYLIEMKDSAVSAYPNSYTVGCRFQEMEFFPLVRFPQSTFLTFVVNCITYLDTFLGISLITLVEVIYFFIVVIVRYAMSFTKPAKLNNDPVEFNEISTISVNVTGLLPTHGFPMKEYKNRRATVC